MFFNNQPLFDMIDRMIDISGERLFVSIAENDSENKRLESLSRETKYFCATFAKTGLQVVFEHEICDKKVLVVSLNKLVTLNEEEIKLLKEKIQTIGGNHETKV